MSEREPKLLVLGQDDIAGATCVQWFQESVPNIADFDVVFVDEVSLGAKLAGLGKGEIEHELLALHRKWLEQAKENLVKVIASSGRIYAILGPTDVTKLSYVTSRFRERIPHLVQASEWCPFPVERKDETGDTFIFVNKDFQDYFDGAVDSWTQTLGIESESMAYREDGLADIFDSTEGKRKLYEIAVNRQRQPVAAAFGYVDMRKNEGSNGRGGWRYGDEFDTGVVVLMPAPTKTDSRQALLLLMQTVAKNLGYPLNQTWEDYENEKFRSRLPAIVQQYYQTPQRLYSAPSPALATPAPSISAEDAEAIRLYKRWKKPIALAEKLSKWLGLVGGLPRRAAKVAWVFATANWMRELASFATVAALVVAVITLVLTA
jgi:hypothetical protein